MKRMGVIPTAVVGTSGLSTAHLAHRFGISRATTDLSTVLDDASIRAVLIATRHDSHAALVEQCLANGKSVYVEKPLATSVSQLEGVCNAYNASSEFVHVGFNRRFAPHIARLKAFLPTAVPPVMVYRVNAGPLHSGHWVLSEDVGGGRVVGEVCHFVDLLQFVAGSPVKSVFASAMPNNLGSEQDISATLTFRSGAIGAIIYTTQGNSKVPKEHLEVYAGGKIGIVDDFSVLTLVTERKTVRTRSRQDKGFHAEVSAFFQCLKTGGPPPIPFAECVTTTLATLAVLESCRSGAEIQIPEVRS